MIENNLSIDNTVFSFPWAMYALLLLYSTLFIKRKQLFDAKEQAGRPALYKAVKASNRLIFLIFFKDSVKSIP